MLRRLFLRRTPFYHGPDCSRDAPQGASPVALRAPFDAPCVNSFPFTPVSPRPPARHLVARIRVCNAAVSLAPPDLSGSPAPSTWGPAHRRWLSAYAFDSVWQQLAFEEYRRTIEDRLAQCDRLEAALREAVVNWRFYPAVLGLQTMRGVQFTTAVGMLAELGDLSRFAHPRQLMAWLGVTPSEHSSGDKRRQGSITKNGNSYARKLLVEAAWSYQHPARVSPEIQRRHEGIPKPIVDRAWDAQVRLCRRYRKLVARGKQKNIAVVAVARELTGFIWDISQLAMSLAVRPEVRMA